MLSLLIILAGLVMLVLGGGALVRGASQIAARVGVSQLVIGLTVVAFGTSAPELFVNVTGALRGETTLAFGNVVGSNIGCWSSRDWCSFAWAATSRFAGPSTCRIS